MTDMPAVLPSRLLYGRAAYGMGPVAPKPAQDFVASLAEAGGNRSPSPTTPGKPSAKEATGKAGAPVEGSGPLGRIVDVRV